MRFLRGPAISFILFEFAELVGAEEEESFRGLFNVKTQSILQPMYFFNPLGRGRVSKTLLFLDEGIFLLISLQHKYCKEKFVFRLHKSFIFVLAAVEEIIG